ncbi:MAG: hypothetical protein AB8B50_13570 [Pirellulaceae bacterium]
MLNHSSRLQASHTEQSRISSLEKVVLLIACFALFTPLQMQVSVAQDGAVFSVSTQISPPSPPQTPDQEKAEVAFEDEMLESLSDGEAAAVGENFDDATESDAAESKATAEGTLESSDSDQVVELSVEPGARPMLPKDRPAWISAAPDYSTDVHRIYVGSIVVSNEEDADEALDAPLVAAVNNYIDEEVFEELGASENIGITEGYIRRNLINDTQGHLLQLQTSGEPMYQKWVTLEITKAQRDYFMAKRREAVQRSRLVPLGLGLFGLIGLVGASHLLMRRKHGLASAQPFNSVGEAALGLQANEAAVPSRKSGGGIVAVLLTVVFSLGVMGVLAVLMLAGASQRYELHEFQELNVQKEVEAAMEAADSAVEEARSLSAQARKELKSTQESIIVVESGQKIHIKSR